MKIKLLADVNNTSAGSIVICDDNVGQQLIADKQAVEYVEKSNVEEKNMEQIKGKAEDSLGVAVKKVIDGELSSLVVKAPSGINESTDADGGYLVTQPVADKLFGAAFSGAVIYPKCAKLPVPDKANGLKVSYLAHNTVTRTSTPRGYWLSEGGQKTATKFTFGSHTLNLGKLVFYVPMTDEIMEDAPLLEQYVISQVKGRIGWMLDDAILNLSTATSGMMGIFDAGSVAFLATPAASASTAAYLVSLYSGVMPSLRGSAEWYMSNARWQTLIAAVGAGTTASPMPIVDVAGKTILGRPVNVMEQMAATGSAGDILFGDFANGYAVLEKGELEISMSKDVRFEYDETVLRFVLRVAGAPVIAKVTLPDGSVVGAFSTHS